jgi:hypothetical protein
MHNESESSNNNNSNNKDNTNSNIVVEEELDCIGYALLSAIPRIVVYTQTYKHIYINY